MNPVRVIDGRLSLAIVAANEAAEERAFADEARDLTKAIRFLAMQTRLWTPEQLERALTRAANRVEARWIEPTPERAA